MANFVMQHMEFVVMNSLQFPVNIYRSYVDDIFAILNKLNLHAFHLTLKGVHTAIHFTCKTKREGAVSFFCIFFV